jgi:hypothetical protein
MSNILSVNTKDPINISLYEGSGDPGILLDWQSGSVAIACQFSDKNYHELYDAGPVDVALEATAPTPDTIFMDWNSRSYGSMPFYSPMDFESSPAINHTLDLKVKVSLWTNAILIEAGGDACRVAPTACKPLALLELVAAPVATLIMAIIPDAPLTQNDAPVATLICKMPS